MYMYMITDLHASVSECNNLSVPHVNCGNNQSDLSVPLSTAFKM